MAKYVAGPFSAEHLYLQWGGTLPGGDIFSCGLRMASAAGDAAALPDVTDALATAAGQIVGGFHQDPNTGVSPTCVMTYAKLNVIGKDGKYKFTNTHEYTPIGLPGSGASGLRYPNQVTLAISLMTDFTRGPAHRGRFYLPMPTFYTQDDGRITSADALRVKTTAYNMVNQLNDNIPGFNVQVFSRKDGAAAHRLVTDINVGRVYDTQRRRRNALTEAY